MKTMTKTVRKQFAKHPRGLARWEENQLMVKLRRSACSETWAEDQIVTDVHFHPDGTPFGFRRFDPTVFPPGGRRYTKMRYCRSCGRFTPWPAVQLIEHRIARAGPVISATLRCDDCQIATDFAAHRELYDAFPNLKPAGSKTVVGVADTRE